MKTKSKSTSKSKSATKASAAKKAVTLIDKEMFAELLTHVRSTDAERTIDRRKELLAQVAGSIAAGLAMAPSPSITKAEPMAAVAVDIATAILKKVGIAPTEDDVEMPASTTSADSADVGAAS